MNTQKLTSAFAELSCKQVVQQNAKYKHTKTNFAFAEFINSGIFDSPVYSSPIRSSKTVLGFSSSDPQFLVEAATGVVSIGNLIVVLA